MCARDWYGVDRQHHCATDRHPTRSGRDRGSPLPALPRLGYSVSPPRIAVSGVVRSWDGCDRTGVNAAYVRAVLAAGGVPLILSPLLGASVAGSALEGCDGLLLTGGEDVHPSWYGAE